jgi:hypothetical protein
MGALTRRAAFHRRAVGFRDRLQAAARNGSPGTLRAPHLSSSFTRSPIASSTMSFVSSQKG